MAKTKNTHKAIVIEYKVEKIISVCYDFDYNKEDNRVKKISEHADLTTAIEAAKKHATKNKLNYKF